MFLESNNRATRGNCSSAQKASTSFVSAPTQRSRRSSTHKTRALFPFDTAWNPNVDAQSIAPQIFAFSIFPYAGFLYHLTKSGKTPKTTLIGFYFLLLFVAATIPAGIYAKKVYGAALANVDWLHGSAESLLTITNLLIVLGLRQAIREEKEKKESEAAAGSGSTTTSSTKGPDA